jgi:hypothetical protein
MQFMSASRSNLVSDEEKEGELVDTVNSLASIYVISLDAADDIDVEDENQVISSSAPSSIRSAHTCAKRSIRCPKRKTTDQDVLFPEIARWKRPAKKWISRSRGTSRLHARALELLFKRIRGLASRAVFRSKTTRSGGSGVIMVDIITSQLSSKVLDKAVSDSQRQRVSSR